MDLDDLKRKAAAACETGHSIGPRSFTLRVPTRYQVSLVVARHGGTEGDQGQALFLIARRMLLEQALVGWAGVLVSDILPDSADATAQPHEPGAVPLLLDAQPAWAGELSDRLVELIAERNQRQDSAAKN